LAVLSLLLAAGCLPHQVDRAGPDLSAAPSGAEQKWGIPFAKDGVANGQILEATFYLPQTAYLPEITGRPLPLVILSHGSPRGQARPTILYREQAKWFTDRGFAVVVPMRRGYGRSHGSWSEGYGACGNADYTRAGLATADDILATLAYFRDQSLIDPDRILLVGQSAGGFGSVAAASRKPAGVRGVINFAGGRGSQSSGSNCSPDALVAAMESYGRTTDLPSLWIYTRTDRYFGPALSGRMYQAFDRASPSSSDYRLLDTTPGDGHSLFTRDIPAWSPVVQDWLTRQGLP
ncbi:MAG: alpha/beta fold hydrolase, partial [Rhodospirillales bacterium]